MGPAEDGAHIPRIGPQEPGNLRIVVAVVVTEHEGGPDLRLEVGEDRFDEVPVGDALRRVRRPGTAGRDRPDLADSRRGKPADTPPTEVVERGVTDDAVEPGLQRPIAVVLVPALERPGKRIVHRIHGGLGVPQDREGNAVDVVRMLPVRPVDGIASHVLVDHDFSTRPAPESLQQTASVDGLTQHG